MDIYYNQVDSTNRAIGIDRDLKREKVLEQG
jgi:hypothetical protein